MSDLPIYNRDFYAWALEQAQLIRAGRLTEIDLNNVAEEIESYAKTERRELGKLVSDLLGLMLKWLAFPGFQCPHAQIPIERQRHKVACRLKDSPSLMTVLQNDMSLLYDSAQTTTLAETGLPNATFPTICPWSFEQIMDEGFWPSPAQPRRIADALATPGVEDIEFDPPCSSEPARPNGGRLYEARDVIPLPGHRLAVRFFDGTTGTVDMSARVRSPDAGVFAVLADPQRFAEVFVDYGVVTWPGELDLAPDAMHTELKNHGEWLLE